MSEKKLLIPFLCSFGAGKNTKVNDDNKEFWQKTAAIYDSFMRGSSGLYADIAAEAQKYLKKSDYVLEVACGTGKLSTALAPCVRLWEATDFSEKMIHEAKRKTDSAKLHFSVQDATDLPYADKSFDAVMITNALHIMPNPKGAMSEIRRVLKDNGKCIAPTFIWNEKRHDGLVLKLMKLFGFKAYSNWSEERYLKFLSDCGFKVLYSSLLKGGLSPLCFAAIEKR